MMLDCSQITGFLCLLGGTKNRGYAPSIASVPKTGVHVPPGVREVVQGTNSTVDTQAINLPQGEQN